MNQSTPKSVRLSEFCTLNDVLFRRSAENGDRRAYVFLDETGKETASLTYRELEIEARRVAARLRRENAFGERVLLLFPSGLEFIKAFWGCLLAGAVAVPCYPPQTAKKTEKLTGVVADAQPKIALTTGKYLKKIAPFIERSDLLAALSWIDTDDPGADSFDRASQPEIAGDRLAFLQYTSGSTSAPKGVMVSHANLLHNQQMIRTAFRQDENSMIVGWLPLYHDMGLIGNVLQPLFVGGTCVLMSPLTFLQKPLRWLEAVSRYRATTSGAPDFAYRHCVEKITDEETAKLDLSSWKIAFNGAEPVRAETMRRFAEKFAARGFSAAAFYPCYGLAEATLFVTGGAGGGSESPVLLRVDERLLRERVVRETAAGRELTACGKSWGNQKIMLIDREGNDITAGDEIGEICVAGASVAQGYWNKPSETRETFEFVPNNSTEKYLRTGDLGFISGSELFVAGRLKDLLILRGRNHYPHDLEESIEKSHPALRSGGSTAFSLETGDGEALVIVSEIEPKAAKNLKSGEIFASIRRALSELHELQAETILLVRAGSVPKTSSGKIRRFKCREMFTRGEFDAVAAFSQAAEQNAPNLRDPAPILSENVDEKTFLLEKIARLTKIRVDEIKADAPITRYGLDSLGAVEIAHVLETRFNLKIPMSDILRGASVDQLLKNARTASETEKSPEKFSNSEYPLSHNQLALYFFNRLERQSPAYNIARAARISGVVDIEKLREFFTSLTLRHAPLRSRFAERDSKIVQVAAEPSAPDFLVFDRPGSSPEEIRAELGSEADRLFDLDNDPPFRVRILRRSAREAYLLIVFHHLVADFHSLTLVFKELEKIYRIDREPEADTRDTGNAGYAEFVSRQTEFLESEAGENAKRYWLEELSGELAHLNLPTDFPRPPKQTFAGGEFLFELDESLTGKLKNLAEKNGSSLFALILSGYFAFLARYTSQTDLIVGTSANGRTAARFAETFGYFVNPVAIRADLSDDPGFEELNRRVAQKVFSALNFQDYPFARLVRELGVEREAARSPIFQTMFTWQNALPGSGRDRLLNFALNRDDDEKIDLGETAFQSVRVAPSAAQFDLSLTAAEAGGKILCGFQFNTDLFGAEKISKMAESFAVLFAAIAQSPRERISKLEILSASEKENILLDRNRTDLAFADAEKPLHRIIERQAERTPGRVAVRFRGVEVTFFELNRRADLLAHFLSQKGVAPENFVGVFLHRSVDLVVSLLAVLKIGAAYVPVDPSYPRARTEYMLEDSGVKILLTSSDLRDFLPATRAQAVCVDALLPEIENLSGDFPPKEVFPENAAYSIYTSGSTGKPKGAVNSHRAIVNRLLWMQEAYRIDESDTVLQKTPYSFDVSVWEFFWSLMTGARLVLAEPERHADSEYLVETIIRERITTIHFVPSVLRVFLDDANVAGCLSLKRVICSGEALPVDLARKFFEKLPHAELHNLYGPTEAAVDVSFRECRLPVKETSIPIGKPISNTRLYILDELRRPVPVGAAGELFIGGVAPARGYWNKPDLTAEKFVPNPFSDAGERLYRTGDLTRFRLDGEIEYLGRLDDQVKINGVRVELGEIEAALKEFPLVEDCCVVAGRAAGKKLLAYVVVKDGAQFEPSRLREFLNHILPRAVVPQRFIRLEKIPLSPNGKVDRRALPESADEVAANKDFAAPATASEAILLEIWKKTLGAENINVDDNFFAAGGDSIRAIQVRSKARERGLDFELQEIFRRQTVRALAKIAQTFTGEKSAAGNFSLSAADRLKLPAGVVKAYPPTRLQTGLVFHGEHDRDYEIYVTSLRVAAKFDAAAMRRAVRFVTERHEILRTSFELGEFSVPLQLVAQTVEPNFKIEDLTALAVEKQEEILPDWLKNERTSAFDWSVAPLARFTVHLLAAESFQITLSEPVLDGWSVATLLSELLTAYAALVETGKTPALPAPPPFSDYVDLEIDALRSEKQRNFWRENLSGFAGCQLAKHAPEQIAETIQAERIYVEIESAAAQRIVDFANRQGVPLKSVLLAAHLRAVSILTGQTDAATALLYNGRPETMNGERAVGLFLNAVPFRLDLSGADFAEIARRAFSAETELLPNRRFPLSEILRLDNRRALFDTAFNYTHFHAYRVLHSIENIKITDIYASDQTYFPLTAQFNLNHESAAPDLRLAIDFRPAQIDANRAREFAGCLREILHSIGDDDAPVRLLETEPPKVSSVSENIPASAENLAEWLAKIERMSDEEARDLKMKLLQARRR